MYLPSETRDRIKKRGKRKRKKHFNTSTIYLHFCIYHSIKDVFSCVTNCDYFANVSMALTSSRLKNFNDVDGSQH